MPGKTIESLEKEIEKLTLFIYEIRNTNWKQQCELEELREAVSTQRIQIDKHREAEAYSNISLRESKSIIKQFIKASYER